ncbi:MAG: HesA/MoeB/ThiF family protein [Gammaproteobacteria bacterium]|nr:HesA/MoeB/ThiF family protein [Gammaproteobacteria bacterium]
MNSDDNSDDWHTRYARQIALDGWGEHGQRRLAQKSAMIVGLGGLGSPVATYLAAAGIGHLVLNDFDTVDLSNLPRQPLHTTADLNRPKTSSAQESLQQLNPDVRYTLINERLTPARLQQSVAQVDCIIDCSDNFGTRFAVNRAAVDTGVPLVEVAAIRNEGQMIVFRNDQASSPCYRCLYTEDDEETGDCRGQGVLTPLVGVMGSLAATAAINLLVRDDPQCGQLHCFDAGTLQWKSLTLTKDPQCPVCRHATHPE